jgi:lysylphosphatidylglycerol synthetase-like protein (DUF2156 family)
MPFDFFNMAADEDPLAAGCNKIALVLAGNVPLYPIYLYFSLRHAGLPVILYTLVALPFFAATIPVSKRGSLAGRVWLNFWAVINSIFVTWLLGEASGTALFLIPCLALAVLSFRKAEFWLMAGMVALPYGLLLLTRWHFPAPPVDFSPAQDRSLLTLSEVSVASITVVVCHVLGRAHGAARVSEPLGMPKSLG